MDDAMKIETADNGCVVVAYGRRYNFGGNGDQTAAAIAVEAIRYALQEQRQSLLKGRKG